ncbi:UNVERIFIED_CONTAM: hypothetical protein HDU68_010390 [Siphonaria sp. JEL0065]|nr:hypothetical protein HDU68_010390 [Siphonaria sp. JEL0065]
MGGPPPPPPPPGMRGPPPPPPPPGGAAAAPKAASSGDMQNELMNSIKNFRGLKKVNKPAEPGLSVKPKAPILSPEEKARLAKEADEEERSSLFIELLGFMETSHGNMEELTNKAAASTKTSRGFIYNLVRRDFVDGYRVLESMPEKGSRVPLQVYQGMEVNRSIILPDAKEADLKDRIEEGGIVARVHMYRFDDKAQVHTLDEIVLMKGKGFPKPIGVFSEPEPVKDSSSRASLMAWEGWKSRKDDYLQLDYPQFELSFNKLMDQDKITTLQMQKLEQTQVAMRRMAESLKNQFEKFPTSEVRDIVESIPKHLKELTTKLQEERGIIIRGEGLKLTPAFLSTLNLKPKALIEAERALAIAAAEEAKARALEELEKGRQQAEAPVFTYKSFLEKAKEGNVEDLLQKFVDYDTKEDEVETKQVKRMARLKTFHAGVRHRMFKSNEV